MQLSAQPIPRFAVCAHDPRGAIGDEPIDAPDFEVGTPTCAASGANMPAARHAGGRGPAGASSSAWCSAEFGSHEHELLQGFGIVSGRHVVRRAGGVAPRRALWLLSRGHRPHFAAGGGFLKEITLRIGYWGEFRAAISCCQEEGVLVCVIVFVAGRKNRQALLGRVERRDFHTTACDRQTPRVVARGQRGIRNRQQAALVGDGLDADANRL